jgi:hypothetical protein
MTTLRNVAGSLMLMSSVTHLSEIYVFGWGSPVMAVVVGFGLAFLVIGWRLLRGGDAVLWWGAILPALAAFLGVANSIRNGYIHPYTIWHLAVDLTVFPICAYLLVQHRSQGRE